MPRIDLPAGPVDYTDTGGDGPVLVFAHGLLMNETLWRSVIPLLQRDYRCIAPTLPLGAHRSPMRPDADLSQLGVARILADVLDALELTDATVVLNDWGGGQFLVSDGRADRVGRLELASCEAFDNFPPRPARPAVALCRVPGGTRVFLRLLGTRFFRHDKRAWGGLSKAGIPDAVLDDWFAPATHDGWSRCSRTPGGCRSTIRGRCSRWISRTASPPRCGTSSPSRRPRDRTGRTTPAAS